MVNFSFFIAGFAINLDGVFKKKNVHPKMTSRLEKLGKEFKKSESSGPVICSEKKYKNRQGK